MSSLVKVKELAKQIRGLVVVDEWNEGLLLSAEADERRVGRLYVVLLSANTAEFYIPEPVYLRFTDRSEIPKWLVGFLKKRTRKQLAEWSLIERDSAYVYILHYTVDLRKLTASALDTIAVSMLKEHMQFVLWATMITKVHRKSFKDINPDPFELQMGLQDAL